VLRNGSGRRSNKLTDNHTFLYLGELVLWIKRFYIHTDGRVKIPDSSAEILMSV
jgi:hypothetical protein